MITSVDTVMVGATAPTSLTTVSNMADGAVALFDQNRTLITTAANAVDATSVFIGVKHGDDIEYSNEIQKDSKPSMVYGTYTAPVNSVATIDLTNSSITAGYRYVTRILYKDIEAANFQFTHTYEQVAANTSVTDLVAAFVSKINAHKNRRVNASADVLTAATKTIGGITFEAVTAGAAGNNITIAFAAATTTAAISVTGSAITITPKTGELTLAHIQALIATDNDVAALIKATAGTATGSAVSATALTGGVNAGKIITLTAMDKDDNEGVTSIDEYSIVDMSVSFYYTDPTKFISNVPQSVTSAIVTTTVGNPGKGYWKQIRDAENRQAGSKQYVMTGAYPQMNTVHYVDATKTYDYINIECENNYLSCDNQYIKNTPIAIELYVVAGQLSASVVKAALTAFITGEAA